MSRSSFSLNADAEERGPLLEDAISKTRETYDWFRRALGLKTHDALAHTAEALGITRSRAKALSYRELFFIRRADHGTLVDRYIAHLDDRGAWHARQTAALRLRKQQLELDLNRGGECSGFGLSGNRSVTGGGRKP